ncbi:xanthine dehydrogenase accessory protein XdhC [Mangrovicella endophytica]|uniref:xanthine dehydrogenase accessory protein XdhC n=1 Tax=Mangrovicella endophytica TaxID=2066697 RepID=UPI000C9DCA7D|nr:xanthine dehydrogenase accessory protein XdhC [Mangrovicella endophytica]
MTTPAGQLAEMVAADQPAILVTVAEARGSTPREAGVRMIVTPDDVTGTIGGGRLEFNAIERARRMLHDGERVAMMKVPLGPAIGQCCGGSVSLQLEMADAALLSRVEAQERAERDSRPAVMIFGAGPTGQALTAALAPLPFAITLIDSRRDRLDVAPQAVTTIASALPEAEIDQARPRTGFVVMTHDHALDFLLAARALRRGDAAYVGMIGSATKRERFRRYLKEEGDGDLIGRLVLPIGGSALRDKRPEVIAAMTAAELAVCLLSNQGEKLHGTFAAGLPRCNSEADQQRDQPPLHAAAS